MRNATSQRTLRNEPSRGTKRVSTTNRRDEKFAQYSGVTLPAAAKARREVPRACREWAEDVL